MSCTTKLSPFELIMRWVIFVIAAIFIWLMLVTAYDQYWKRHHTKPLPDIRTESQIEDEWIWDAATKHVLKRLKSPGSAVFCKTVHEHGPGFVGVLDPEGNRYVYGWVDSQNDYGALLRKEFRLTIKTDGHKMTVVKEVRFTDWGD